MSLSDFHIGLVALLSPELFERMRLARAESVEVAARNRAQMTDIVRALRGDIVLAWTERGAEDVEIVDYH